MKHVFVSTQEQKKRLKQRKSNSKGQSRMEAPEKHATVGTNENKKTYTEN